MKSFNKFILSIFTLFMGVVSFAQQARAEREGFNLSSGDEAGRAGGPSLGNPAATPIDQYELLLLIAAVSIIAFVAYKYYVSKKKLA